MEKKRLLFIDILRGLAVFAMIETHIVNSIMMEKFRTGVAWDTLNILNGFISVAFLFLAGSTFMLGANRKFSDFRAFKAPLWLYLRKLGFILVIAYALHLPVLSIFQLGNLSYKQLLFWFESDILQNIGYTSIFALIVLLLTPRIKYLKYIYALLAVIVFLITPAVWNLDPFQSMPVFFATLFAEPPISKFPLIPWSGYFLAGAAFTNFFFVQENKIKFSIYSIIASFIIMLLCFLTKDYLSMAYGWSDWWQGFPTHSLFRLSGTVIVFCSAYILEKKLPSYKFLKAFAICGKESLLVYYGHLMIIYGSIVNFGFAYLLGPRLHWSSALITIICMCIFFYFAALAWHTLKTEKPKYARYALIGTGLLVISFMFFY